MEEDLDANIIKATQLSLGKYVKRPPLSDKLLRKPPFRFLHDIVTSVLRSNGFFEGLFEESELISDNVKDRDSKILFLNKVISVVSLTTSKSLSVKSSKIVAGQEPAKTNELLQCLALALDKNLSSDAAVKQLKTDVKIRSSNDKKKIDSVTIKPARNVDLKKLTSRSSEKLVSNDKLEQIQNKSKIKESNLLKKETPPKKTLTKAVKKHVKSNEEAKKNQINIEQKTIKPDSKKKPNSDTENIQNLNNIANEYTAAPDIESQSDEKNLQPEIQIQEEKFNLSSGERDKKDNLDFNESISSPVSTSTVDTSIKNSQIAEIELSSINDNLLNIKNDHDENEEIKLDLANTKSQITVESNNRFSDTLNEKIEEQRKITNSFASQNIQAPSIIRPSSSRPGAPRLKDKTDNGISDSGNIALGKVNIISENAVHEEEEETSIIIENIITDDLHAQLKNNDLNSISSQSHLVQQILDAQKEFSQTSAKTEIEWPFGTQKTPDVYLQEMENLRFNVQALSRIGNPLGKLMDHIQEDVEVMRQELQQWTSLYEKTTKDLLKQKSANEESLLPFYSKLRQLTTDIQDKQERLIDLKISVSKNASRINKLLANGNVQ